MPTRATGLQFFPPRPILPSNGFAPVAPRVARLIELRINRDRETSRILRSLARQPPPTLTNARPLLPQPRPLAENCFLALTARS